MQIFEDFVDFLEPQKHLSLKFEDCLVVMLTTLLATWSSSKNYSWNNSYSVKGKIWHSPKFYTLENKLPYGNHQGCSPWWLYNISKLSKTAQREEFIQ